MLCFPWTPGFGSLVIWCFIHFFRKHFYKASFLSYSGENAHHVAAWKIQPVDAKVISKKKEVKIFNFCFKYCSFVSFSHPAVGGRKREKTGSQSWFMLVIPTARGLCSHRHGCSFRLESLTGGQKGVPECIYYTEVKDLFFVFRRCLLLFTLSKSCFVFIFFLRKKILFPHKIEIC